MDLNLEIGEEELQEMIDRADLIKMDLLISMSFIPFWQEKLLDLNINK